MATESALRSRAKHRGYQLMKSRRDGTFMLVDASTDYIVWGDHNDGYGLALDEVEELLADD